MTEKLKIPTQGLGQQVAYLPHFDPEAIAEHLAAFANADGGTLVLGMGADGKLGDIRVEEDAADALQSALRLCRPPVRTDWSHQEMAGGTVVVLNVARGMELHSLWDGRVMVRRGRENLGGGPRRIARR